MKKLLFGITLATFITQAGAGNYGMAGCGIGALAFGDEPGYIQIVAATLNNILIPQTSAITSGTSNCTEDGVSVKDKEQQMFLEANYESLIQEIAQGSGAHLSAFATLFGCNNTQIESFSSVMQDNFQIIQQEPEGAALENIRKVFSDNFSGACRENG
jgi:hypothetical protein